MIEMDANPDLKHVEKRLGNLKNKAPLVMSRAMNRAITNVKTNMAKKAAERYHVKQKDVKPTITVKKSSSSNLSAEAVSTTTKKIALAKFRTNPTAPRQRRPPAFYRSQVLKRGSLKDLSGSADRSKGFVATMSSGHKGVFERTGRKTRSGREQIAELFGPPIPSMIGQRDNAEYIQSEGSKKLQERLDHEIKRVLEAGV